MVGEDQTSRDVVLGHITKFIVISGSCGKTTTKDLTAGILEPSLRGINSADDANCGAKLVDHVLRVRPDDDFYIQELGAWGPGTLDAGLELVRPDIGVVLNIRHDHYSGFRGLANTQAEKSKVVKALASTGTAILNVDDPYVWQMRNWTSASVLSFGLRECADFRASSVSSVWPARLSFNLTYGGKKFHVKTQLLGEHLAGSALAALATATVMGIPLQTAIERLAMLQPTPRRMSPAFLRAGPTFIRDEFKATNDSMTEMVQFLEQARAKRKIAVLGHLSDYRGRSRRPYTTYARNIADVTDLLVLVGTRPEDLWGRHRRREQGFLSDFRGSNSKVHLFETVQDASRYLWSELGPGDLVLLKGSGVFDHLERIFLQWEITVQCWKPHCGKSTACDECEHLGRTARRS